MRFIKYEGDIPDRVCRREYNRLKDYFEGFIKSNIKAATIEIDKGEYKSSTVAVAVLKRAAKRHGYPVELFRRGDVIYIVRTDM
jgi:hypothetical protein